MASKCTNCQTSPAPRRLLGVPGDVEKKNDVILCGNLQDAKQHVIFFGGDVQDFKENMDKYFNIAYKEWNLESTAQLLQSRFSESAVFVIKPSKMLLNTFSIFKNFLKFDEDGRPEFSPDFGAFVHLAKLYKSAKAIAADVTTVDSDCVPVKLVGFSKGCLVLNQLMFELTNVKEHADVKPFLDQVEAMFWLDGGHTGCKDAYITDINVLKTIKDLGKQLVVHVTPYEVKDQNRPWIGREERHFVKKLQDLKANIKEYRHFMDEPGSIENHFNVLTKV